MPSTKNMKKLPRKKLNQAIATICRERMPDDSEDSIIIGVNEVTTVLETDFDIDVEPVTVRRRGFHNRGYYERMYSDICSYNNFGDTRMRGLVVKPQKFIDEVET